MKRIAAALTLLLTLVLFAGPVAAQEASLFDALPQQEEPAAPPVGTADELLGTWTLVRVESNDELFEAEEIAAMGSAITLTFRADGTVLLSDSYWPELDEVWVYTVNGDRITMIDTEWDLEFDLTLANGVLTMVDAYDGYYYSYSYTYTFTKGTSILSGVPRDYEAPPRYSEGINIVVQTERDAFTVGALLGKWTLQSITVDGWEMYTAEELERYDMSITLEFRADGVVLVDYMGWVDEYRYTVSGSSVQILSAYSDYALLDLTYSGNTLSEESYGIAYTFTPVL